jgi:hypothetical protein
MAGGCDGRAQGCDEPVATALPTLPSLPACYFFDPASVELEPSCPSPDPFPSEDDIAQRAFDLCFVARTPCPDRVGYLQAAEQELLDRSADRTVRQARP